MNAYFNKSGNKNHKDYPRKFWNTMKPFANDKAKSKDECQMLNINGTVCNDSDITAEEFNSYFSNVNKNICKEKPLEYDGCLKYTFIYIHIVTAWQSRIFLSHKAKLFLKTHLLLIE